MLVTIWGPELKGGFGHGATFVVHAEGCKDNRKVERYGNEALEIEVASRLEVADVMYGPGAGGFYAESGTSAIDYVGDFHFPPCTDDLPLGEES
jgi:hypothetical protein